MSQSDTARAVRIDKWLWAARFYKTRSLAVDAIKQGRVQCNRERPKPSRMLRVGDALVIEKGDLRFEIAVLEVSEQRRPARVAQQLYRESEESRRQREQQSAQRRAQRLSAPLPPQTRPDKHARQRIRRLMGK